MLKYIKNICKITLKTLNIMNENNRMVKRNEANEDEQEIKHET